MLSRLRETPYLLQRAVFFLTSLSPSFCWHIYLRSILHFLMASAFLRCDPIAIIYWYSHDSFVLLFLSSFRPKTKIISRLAIYGCLSLFIPFHACFFAGFFFLGPPPTIVSYVLWIIYDEEYICLRRSRTRRKKGNAPPAFLYILCVFWPFSFFIGSCVFSSFFPILALYSPKFLHTIFGFPDSLLAMFSHLILSLSNAPNIKRMHIFIMANNLTFDLVLCECGTIITFLNFLIILSTGI